MLNYIPSDGFTEPFYIAAESGLYEKLQGSMRPMGRRPLAKLRERIRPLGEEATDEVVSEVIASHLASWSLADEKGQAIPISTEAVFSLRPALWFKLVNIVQGNMPSDVDPASDNPGDGKTSAERLAADQGNLQPG